MASSSSPKTPIIKNPPPKARICFRFDANGKMEVDPYHAARTGFHYNYSEMKEGNLLIQCLARDSTDLYKPAPTSFKIGSFTAMASTADLEIIGVVYGTRRYDKIENLECYAIKQGMGLDKKLREMGLHKGPALVNSSMEHPPEYLKELEKGNFLTDLCFGPDDELNTCKTVIGSEQIKVALPGFVLGAMGTMKANAAERKKQK